MHGNDLHLFNKVLSRVVASGMKNHFRLKFTQKCSLLFDLFSLFQNDGGIGQDSI